jgi:ferredoxin
MLDIDLDPRTCEGCGDEMIRTTKTSAKEWDRKRFCGQVCRVTTLKARNHLRAGSSISRLTVPESARRVATRDGIPQRCPTCSGLWKQIMDGAGVSCLSCGRDLWISAALPG